MKSNPAGKFGLFLKYSSREIHLDFKTFASLGVHSRLVFSNDGIRVTSKFPLGTTSATVHIPPTRQGSFTIMEPRFSDARNTPSEPDAGHAAVGSRNRQQFPFPPAVPHPHGLFLTLLTNNL